MLRPYSKQGYSGFTKLKTGVTRSRAYCKSEHETSGHVCSSSCGIQVGIGFHGWLRVSFYYYFFFLSPAESVTRYFWSLWHPGRVGLVVTALSEFHSRNSFFFCCCWREVKKYSMWICFGRKKKRGSFEATHRGAKLRTNQNSVWICKYIKSKHVFKGKFHIFFQPGSHFQSHMFCDIQLPFVNTN